MELFKQRARIDLLHIPYKESSAAYTDMMDGQLDALFDSLPGAMPFFKIGPGARTCGIDGETRCHVADVPTLAESGLAEFNVLVWLGVVVPAGLNPAIRNKIDADLKKALATDAVKQRMEKIRMQTVGCSPEDFGKYIASEYGRWGDVIRTSNIKAD